MLYLSVLGMISLYSTAAFLIGTSELLNQGLEPKHVRYTLRFLTRE